MIGQIRIPAYINRTGNSRPSFKDLALFRRIISIDNIPFFRPRANNGHFSTQYVPKLRQLIDLGLAQQLANRRDTIIMHRSYLAIAGVLTIMHGAQLIHIKLSAPQSGPFSSIKGRPWRS